MKYNYTDVTRDKQSKERKSALENITAICAARKSSGLYQQECADIMDMSLPTYRNIELENEDRLTLGNLKSILPHMNGISRKIMRDKVDEIFLPYE